MLHRILFLTTCLTLVSFATIAASTPGAATDLAVAETNPDAVRVTPEPKTDAAQTFELNDLQNRAADHATPDAVVRVPLDFDPTHPIHLVVYNHGWGSNARTCYVDNQLSVQMLEAPANSILFIPEWQQVAAARSGEQGHFKDHNLFKEMITESFAKIPALKNLTLADVDTITIFAHSAGYGPTETEINDNDGIAEKVINITLLDALYDKFGFDEWIEKNLKDLTTGKKRFYNFFNGTPIYSKALADRVLEILHRSCLPTTCMVKDYDDGDKLLSVHSIETHPIVFKFSTAGVGTLGAHMSMPLLYVGLVEQAARRRARAQE